MIEFLGAVGLLLLLGGISGHATRVFSRTDDDRAQTWGTRGPLTAAVVAAAAITALAVWQLVTCGSGTSCTRPVRVLPLPPPVAGFPSLDLTLRVDATAAIFLLVVGSCGTCIAVYSFGWLREDRLRNRVAGSFCLFLLAMVLVVLVNNIFWLFVALELMTFCSGDLVRYRGASGGPVTASRTAVRTYLIVSHIGLICLVVGVLPIVVGHGTLDMSVLSASHGSPVPGFSFSFILLGLALRAGVTPFHFWVPTVHPQLPTNTHAMVSAVMLKIPVYLMLRFFVGGIVGPVQWWWGATILVLAGGTALVTVFYAMITSNLKVALAYHSVENIGIILAGLGLALLFSDHRFASLPAVRDAAGLALLASLYHVINHGIFKSLLFLCVGSIERQTGTVELSELGGLCRTLPWTAFTFLIGAAAIAELPPLNGFVSGWLTFQALFSGQQVYDKPTPVGLFIMPAVIVALVTLALALGATALAFVKISGQALLGQPRGARAPGREPWSMRTIMTILAGLCLLLGLQPWLLVPWLSAALASLNYRVSGLSATPTQLTIGVPATGGSLQYHATLPILPLLLLVGAALGLTALLGAWRWTRRPVWVGGTTLDPNTMGYSGNALSALLWEPMSQPRSPQKLMVPSRPDRSPVPEDDGAAATYLEELPLSPRRSVPELANYAFNRLAWRIVAASDWFGNRFQNGDVRGYLLYMFLIVLLVLVVLAVAL
jgi:formate hydrogenlyase subunit 3/multisubunit Na+/H+ antiporter MnhD subunit